MAVHDRPPLLGARFRTRGAQRTIWRAKSLTPVPGAPPASTAKGLAGAPCAVRSLPERGRALRGPLLGLSVSSLRRKPHPPVLLQKLGRGKSVKGWRKLHFQHLKRANERMNRRNHLLSCLKGSACPTLFYSRIS
ncbi:vesicle transport protein SFT2A isoform X10 [Nannospalax galili]|uniref:vesicle transport protein SFT2A isoform X10 n=1 Tax=Nannospalax galili TaxID=1026970 RepID=UPI00111C17C5|nr:vesicle transport protein SFT2A isoform X10 [Nannospalax galili]